VGGENRPSPLLCIPKKDGRLRAVVDCRERNLNTVMDLRPFPDQDMIRNDVARAPFRTKLDMSDPYEQVRVEPEDVKNTALSTIIGTFLSNVMQQGDFYAGRINSWAGGWSSQLTTEPLSSSIRRNRSPFGRLGGMNTSLGSITPSSMSKGSRT
jgi:hypothetical protein